MKLNKQTAGQVIMALLTVAAIIGLFLLPRMQQNLTYHNFCDGKTILGIPNFWNVCSNLPFLFVGVLGMLKLSRLKGLKHQLFILFLATSLIALGSAYYHLDPNNQTLVWDRLPMAIVFMTLFSVINDEYSTIINGKKMFIPAVLLGILSVLYWAQFDDLRPYLLVQFYPMLITPVILIFFNSKYNLTGGYWLLVFTYLLAKMFEYFDCQTLQITKYISGHSLKHLFASLSLLILCYTFMHRKLRIR